MELWPVNNGLLVVLQVQGDLNVVGHHTVEVNLRNFNDISDERGRSGQIEGSLPDDNGQFPIGKLEQNVLTFNLPLFLRNGLNILDLDLNLGRGAQEPINLLKHKIIIDLIHLRGIGGQEVLLRGRGMNQRLDVVIKGGFLQVIGGTERLLLIQQDILIQVLPPDQREPQMRDLLIQRERQVLPHLPEHPIENDPNSQWISCDLVGVLVVLDQVDEGLLLLVLGLGVQEEFVGVHLVEVGEVEDFLGEERVAPLVEIFVAVLVVDVGG